MDVYVPNPLCIIEKHKLAQRVLSILICGKQSKAHLRAHDGKLDIHKMLTIENLIKPGAERKVIRWHQ